MKKILLAALCALTLTFPAEALVVIDSDSDEVQEPGDDFSYAVFTFKFEIESEDDNLLALTATRITEEGSYLGTTYQILDSSGNTVQHGFTSVILVIEGKEVSDGKLLVQEGTIEHIELDIFFHPEVTGSYRAQLLGIEMLDLENNHSYISAHFIENSDELHPSTKTQFEFVQAPHVPELSTFVLASFGGIVILMRRYRNPLRTTL